MVLMDFWLCCFVVFHGGFNGGADVFCGGARGGFWW